MGEAVYDQVSYQADLVKANQELTKLVEDTLSTLKSMDTRSIGQAFARLEYSEWGNLPGAKVEVEAIDKLVKDAEIVTGNAVKESLIKQMSKDGDLANYKVLHYFATHGKAVPEFREISSIVLSQFKNPQGSEDGYLRMGEIAELDLQTNFVILSACETGLDKTYAGEEVFRLAHSFLIAGVNGLSVFLWSEADESTMLFMVGIYQLVQSEGMSYFKAINEMKRAFINEKFSRKSLIF